MNYAQARTNMVDSQIHTSGVVDPALLEAFETVPREMFVPENLRNIAYCDEEIAIGEGRFLLEPLTLSRMIQEINPSPDDVVLDIGGATGYAAAILSFVTSTVVALEENESFLNKAETVWKELGLCNIVGKAASLKDGYPEKAPFDIILLNGAVPEIPHNLCEQLSPGGRLVTILKETQETPGRVTITRATQTQTLGEMQFSSYNAFDAGAPYLPGFEPRSTFSF